MVVSHTYPAQQGAPPASGELQLVAYPLMQLGIQLSAALARSGSEPSAIRKYLRAYAQQLTPTTSPVT